MKYYIRLSILTLSILLSLTGKSQTFEIWGTFPDSNLFDLGCIFRIDTATSLSNIEKNFYKNAHDAGAMIEANNGKFYGVRRNGGFYGQGTIYEVDPNNNVSEELYHFNSPVGYFEAKGNLSEVVPGELWGVATGGGSNGTGVVYSYNYLNGNYNVEFDISNINLESPSGELIEAPNGKIYGLARYGPNLGDAGGIFEIDLASNVIIRRYKFQTSNSMGDYPEKMILGQNGRFYGLCATGGGTTGSGTLFEYNYVTHNVSKVRQFYNNSGIGDVPIPATLFNDNNGKLYGMTSRGGANGIGALFEYNVGGSVNKIMDLNSTNRNFLFTEMNGSNLLGVKVDQAPFGFRSHLIEYNPINNNFTSLFSIEHYSFNPVKHSSNKFFLGGDYIMQLDTTLTNGTFIDKSGYSDGGDILDPMCEGLNGNLYGYSTRNHMTQKIFKIDPVSKSYNMIYEFEVEDSIWNLTHGFRNHPNGKLYSVYGRNWGNSGPSGLLELNPLTDSFSVVYRFPSSMERFSSLEIDQNGNIYVVAKDGGYKLFKVDSSFNNHQVLASLSSGTFSYTELSLDSGKLYIPTNQNSDVRIYRFDITTQSLESSHSSNFEVYEKLEIGRYGEFYGARKSGGIFKYDPSKTFNNRFSILPGTNNLRIGSIMRKENMLYGVLDNLGSYSLIQYNLDSGSTSFKSMHKFDSSKAFSNFSWNHRFYSIHLLGINVCRPSLKPTLSLSHDTICPTGSTKIIADLSELNSGYAWELFEGDTTNLMATDSSGIFNVSPTGSTWYFVKGKGNCFTQAPFDSIKVIIDSSYSSTTQTTASICKYENFIKPNGDTLFNVTSSLLDTTSFSTPSACDSMIVTSISVDTVNVSIFQNNTTLSAQNSTATSYEWIDCINDSSMNATGQSFTALYNGTFAVIIDENGCQDTSICTQILSVGLNNNSLEGNMKLSPNPTTQNIQLQLLKEENIEVKVRDLQGKLLSNQSFTNQKQAVIELNQSPGIYFLEISNAQGEKVFKKVVKQ